MAVREKKITARNVLKIVSELAKVPDETNRFNRLTATADTLLLVTSTPQVYEMALNMLTGYNRVVLEASSELSTKKRYDMVSEVVCKFNVSQFAALANVFPTTEYLLLLKQRCNLCNDNAACIRLEQVIHGEPEAEDDDEEIAQLGLMGLWTVEGNRQAGTILVILGAITKEEYDHAISEMDGVKIPPPEPPIPQVEVTPTPPPAPPEPPIPQVEVTPTPPPAPPEPPIPQVEVIPPTPPTPQVEDLTSMKKSIEERMEQLKQEEIIINLKIQLEEERRKREELEKSIGSPGGDSPLVVKESRIPPSALSVVYMRPEDYEKWGFVDFEGIIPGLKFGDLQVLFNHVGLSQKMSEQEKDTIREIITKRINNLTHNGV